MRRPQRRRDPSAFKHDQWLGAVQPEGLVFSVPVLVDGVTLARVPTDKQVWLRLLCPDLILPSLDAFFDLASAVLEWPAHRIDRAPGARWRLDLPDLGHSLAPDAVVRDGAGAPLLFVCFSAGNPDQAPPDDHWSATPQQRVERLLIAAQHPAPAGAADDLEADDPDASQRGPAVALHVFAEGIRLVYAPTGAAPGHLTFPMRALASADGRDVLDAFVAVLGKGRLFSGGHDTRLPALLAESRARQADVTTTLAAQAEAALRVLLQGFDAADAHSNGAVFADVRSDAGRAHVYEGLVTTLLRLLFVLFAEDRGLLPTDNALYAANYSVGGLAERLADDLLAHPQAMDRRYGAWARLLATFRLVYAGAPSIGLPERHGTLFDPDAFPFLEGRPWHQRDDTGSQRWRAEAAQVPRIDDGTLAQVLGALVRVDGQRLSYSALSEEQLGSMHEALMGFELRFAASPAVPLPGGCHVELGALREAADPLAELAGASGLKPKDLRAKVPDLLVFSASTQRDADYDALREALAPLRPAQGTEVPAGGHYLQPSDARRKSGSHYTPSNLTDEVVRHTLAPLIHPPGPDGTPGPALSPAQILDLRICDPAMGSGAFLVQVVRVLGQALAEAWARTGTTPPQAGDRADLLARRRVAERCIYGVDLNPLAVRLAKLSLWLVTLARDLPFTFVDHALREGDALTGIDRRHVRSWKLPPKTEDTLPLVKSGELLALGGATALRGDALAAIPNYDDKNRLLHQAEDIAAPFVAAGDAMVGVYSVPLKKAELASALAGLKALDMTGLGSLDSEHALVAQWRKVLLSRPFHWQAEFPEVFARDRGGFDAVVGNPPFGGKNTLIDAMGDHYIKLLQALRPHAHGNADLSAHFFLRAAEILRPGGTFGLIATNTISQGDTRETGLQYLVSRGVSLFRARKDVKWISGGAAVTVNVVHGLRGNWTSTCWLDDRGVAELNSALSQEEEWGDPKPLAANRGRVFEGTKVYGAGFVLTPDEAADLLALDPNNSNVIFPYQGGRELNTSPDYGHQRYVIDFRDWSLESASHYPAPFERVLRLVKPERDQLKDNADGRRRRLNWWQHGRRTPALDAMLGQSDRCMAWSQVSKFLGIAFLSSKQVFANTLEVFPSARISDFAVLQSQTHEAWARTMGSSLKTDLRYTPSTCFETFPFPPAEHNATLAQVGEALHSTRSAYMLKHQVGMTETWNRLTEVSHPEHQHPEIVHLRQVREAMDRAVLAAYGWQDLEPDDAPTIVRRLRALNAQRYAEEQQA